MKKGNLIANVLCAYEYARYVLRGRFELSEKGIATDAEYSYRYARHALNGRFELGVIATNAHYSYNYAKYDLRKDLN